MESRLGFTCLQNPGIDLRLRRCEISVKVSLFQNVISESPPHEESKLTLIAPNHAPAQDITQTCQTIKIVFTMIYGDVTYQPQDYRCSNGLAEHPYPVAKERLNEECHQTSEHWCIEYRYVDIAEVTHVPESRTKPIEGISPHHAGLKCVQ